MLQLSALYNCLFVLVLYILYGRETNNFFSNVWDPHKVTQNYVYLFGLK